MSHEEPKTDGKSKKDERLISRLIQKGHPARCAKRIVQEGGDCECGLWDDDDNPGSHEGARGMDRDWGQYR